MLLFYRQMKFHLYLIFRLHLLMLNNRKDVTNIFYALLHSQSHILGFHI